MPYSNFTLDSVEQQFGVHFRPAFGHFSNHPVREPHAALRTLLAEWIPLALAINSEKARSELIVAPLLVELWKMHAGRVSYFSGVDFEVDAGLGLNGTCDFLISQSPQQLFVEAPVIMLVEAKRDNVRGGWGQCLAEMVAARLFNDRAGHPQPELYGVVTTGSVWNFLQLSGESALIDTREYSVDQPERILGILSGMIAQTRTFPATSCPPPIAP